MKAVAARPRNNSSMARDRSSWAATEATLEFGRFRVLLRQRQLVADGVPIELGTRAFDLLLVLLDADTFWPQIGQTPAASPSSLAARPKRPTLAFTTTVIRGMSNQTGDRRLTFPLP